MDDAFTAGNEFLTKQARLLERRLFATCFLDAPATGVIDALRGYQNADGGFGHGLEPDKRCPASLPIDVEVALGAMSIAGTSDETMVRRACDFLARIADEADAGGAVPPAFPVIESFPRAAHWTEWTYEPGVNPTAGLVGLLYKLGTEHPWLTRATEYCWDKLESGQVLGDVHTFSEALVFLEHVPDRERADRCAAELADRMAEVPGLKLAPDAEGYGLSPLHFAPTAQSRWRELFTTEQIDAHLDKLLKKQQPDGGWTIGWEPPSEASTLEWRGIVTLDALRTLTSYGRLQAAELSPLPSGHL